MSEIKILPDMLVSKIAAGEVVQRPSSVVKELIENSLDAGAKKLTVNIESGGKKSVVVIDDGIGMSKDDALMSLEQHATSKISSVDDLFALTTLGFRGEALASISSVSRLRLLTRRNGNDSGVVIFVDGGKIRSVEDAGCPVGTTVEVRNLFFNTIPRLKFLKRDETEFINITEIVQREAIVNPEVAFEVHHDGRLIFRLASKENVLERAKEIVKNCELYEINYISNGMEISGCMSSPFEGRSNTQRLYTYVNSRTVKDRFVTRMIMDAYGKMLPKGKFPQGVLCINLQKSEVDVNVHPTKYEVKFREQNLVGGVIKNSLSEMLSTAPWMFNHKNIDKSRSVHFLEETKESYRSSVGNFSTRRNTEYGSGNQSLKNTNSEGLVDIKNQIPGGHVLHEIDIKRDQLFGKKGHFSSMKIIGQVGALYIVCENQDGIVLIDQHAAHERVNYEIYRKNYLESGSIQKQELLLPEVIDLSPKEMKIFEKHRVHLTELGFEAEPFGNVSVRVRSVPAILKLTNAGGVFTDILLELDDLEESKSLNDRLDLVCATMSCHSSIRANEALGREKISALLHGLDNAEFPHSCPHGRPVAKMITYKELEKMFGRI